MLLRAHVVCIIIHVQVLTLAALVEALTVPQAWVPTPPRGGLFPEGTALVLVSVSVPHSLKLGPTDLGGLRSHSQSPRNRLVSEPKATRGQQSIATALYTHSHLPDSTSRRTEQDWRAEHGKPHVALCSRERKGSTLGRGPSSPLADLGYCPRSVA